MSSPEPNALPPELLAAYADGELDSENRVTVEQWLHDHPAAIDDLTVQRELSPLNVAFWERAAPPEPSAKAFAAVLANVSAALIPPVTSVPLRKDRRWVAAWVIGGLTAAAAAAVVGWLALGSVFRPPLVDHPYQTEQVKRLPFAPPVAPPPRFQATAPAPRTSDPNTDHPVLVLATDNDVVLERVPEFPAGWLPIGRHPLADGMPLATEDEIRLAGVDPSPVWPPGGPKMITAPGDAPLIFTAKPR